MPSLPTCNTTRAATRDEAYMQRARTVPCSSEPCQPTESLSFPNLQGMRSHLPRNCLPLGTARQPKPAPNTCIQKPHTSACNQWLGVSLTSPASAPHMRCIMHARLHHACPHRRLTYRWRGAWPEYPLTHARPVSATIISPLSLGQVTNLNYKTCVVATRRPPSAAIPLAH